VVKADWTLLARGPVTWTIVGLFEADGSVAETEIWCDARTLQGAYRRGNSYQSVLARLESPEVSTPPWWDGRPGTGPSPCHLVLIDQRRDSSLVTQVTRRKVLSLLLLHA